MFPFGEQGPTDSDAEFGALMVRYHDALVEQQSEPVDALVMEMFTLAEEHCEQNPTPDHDLAVKATLCLENAEWQEAECAYRQILEIPHVGPMRLSSTHMDRCRLFRLLNRDHEALEEARAALTAANEAELDILKAFALQGQTRCHLDMADCECAMLAIHKTLSLLPEETLFDHIRAKTLILRAECLLLGADFENAKLDLDRALALLTPYSSQFMAGAHADRAYAWSINASWQVAMGNQERAITAWEMAVGESKHVIALAHADNVYSRAAAAFMLAGLEQAYRAVNRFAEADNLLAERVELIEALRLPTGVFVNRPGEAHS